MIEFYLVALVAIETIKFGTYAKANIVDPDQTTPKSGTVLFALPQAVFFDIL